jgi:hypothetical protein
MDDARLHFPILFERDQYAPKWIPPNEIPSPVNRIDDPPAPVFRFFPSPFLPQNPIVRVGFLKHFRDQFLALSIGNRNRRVIGFIFGGNSGFLMAQSQLGGKFCDPAGCFNLLTIRHFSAW